MRRDSISVIEASYRLEHDDQTWLRGVVGAAAPVLGGGGAVGFLFDSSRPVPGAVLATATEGLSERDFHCFERLTRIRYAGAVRERFLLASPVATISEALRDLFDAAGSYAEVMRGYGWEDAIYVVAGDPDGVPCVLAAPVSARTIPPEARKTSWAYLAAHLAASHRLRRRLSEPTLENEATIEAILSPDGTILDASGPASRPSARQALGAATVARDRALGRLRGADPERALSLWVALVAGRWSLVERIDSDGRRLVEARRNEPGGVRRASLSQRECQVATLAAMGHSNKTIAYEMGMAVSTAASHLQRAMSKLGAHHRVDLVRLFARALPPDEPRAALTRAELAVVEGVVAGLSSVAIAARRRCSARTVENQIASSFRKLGVGSRAELVAAVTAAQGRAG